MADEQDIQQDPQDGTPKLGVKEFAAKIKAKYPDYAGVDDNTLVQKIVSKYPQYKDQIDFGQKKNSLPTSQPSSTVSTPSQNQSVSVAQSTSQGTQPQQPTKPQPFDPATFMRQSRANVLQQPVQDNTAAVQPSRNLSSTESQLNKAAYQQRKAEINKEAVVNSTAQYLKNKGINAPVGSVQFNQQLAKTQDLVNSGQATVAINPDGQIGLKRVTGFLENIKNGWDEATKSADEANEFTNNMTTQQRVDYVKSHDIPQPDQFIGEQPSTFGSLGHFMGGAAPFLGKAAVGAGIGALAIAGAPESMGASLTGLPTAMSFILTAPDMANQGAKQEIIRRYQILKNQNPDMSDADAMEEAGKGALAGGIGGILTNAALMGTGLKTPLSLEAKGVVGKTLQEVGKSAVHMGAVSAGVTAAQQVEGEAEGIHTSTSDKLKAIEDSFKENATTGAMLTALMHGVPKIMESVIKYSLKDTPPDQIRNVLQANENAGTVPEGTTEKVMKDISSYNDALNKTVNGLSPEATASVAGLIQKKNSLIEESKTKDDSFKPIYKEKIDAIDQQIQDIQRTGKPFEHEIDEVTGKPYQQPTYDDVAQQQVQDLAQKIAKGKQVTDPTDLQTQSNFPKELEAELTNISKKEIRANTNKVNPNTDIIDNINKYKTESRTGTTVEETPPTKKAAPSIESAVIEINGKTYEGKNHAEAILKAKQDGQDISQVDRKGQGQFKLSDGTIISRDEAKQRFGQDKAELLIPQDEAAKQADKEYEKETSPKKPAEPVSSPVISDKEETVSPTKTEEQGIGSEPTNTEENTSTNKQEAVPSTTDLEGFGGKGGRNRLYDRVKNLDEPTDIDGKILHYFAGGGKVHPESFSKEVVGMKRKGYGDKEGSYPSEVKGNTLVKATDSNGKPNPTIIQLAESLGDGTNDHEIRNKIIDVLQSHGSRESAATELVNKYDQEYIEAKHQKEENEYWEGLHKQEVAAEENYLTEKGKEQDEIEQDPEYIKHLINQYETETVPANDKRSDTGSKAESGEARSTPKDTQPEGVDKSERPSELRGSSEDKPEPDEGKPETPKGEIKEQPVDPAHPDYKPLDFTAIKNDVVNSEREAQGKEPIKSSGDGTMTRAEQTKAKIESGEISEEHIRDLTQAIATGDKDFVTNLKPDEIQHVLIYDRQTLQNKRSQIESELIGAKETKNDAAVERLLVKQAQNDLLLEANDKAANKTGREWSDAGRARQLIIRNDYSFEALKRRAKAASKDGVLDKASEDRLRELSKLVEQKDAQLLEKNEAIAAADREIAELKELNDAVKNRKSEVSAFDDLKKETKNQIRQQGKRTIEKIKFERENIKANLKAKWKNHQGNLGMNNIIPLDMVPDLIKLAKSYIEEGLAVGKEAVLEHIVDRVHKDVVEAIGDVDKTTVRDAITGYGKIKKPNTDPIDTAFRDIAAQGRLVSSIELAEKGEPPLKSGQQRDKPSVEQRRLQKELNKAIKDNNIQVKSPEEQLKTSLDAAKTRLKNQIEDLSDAIDRNEKIVKDRKGLEYDQEAKDLKAQRDELRDEYDKIFGTNKELTTEERIERAFNAVQKSIEKLNERIANKDFSQNKRVDLKSPELDALKKQREDLQKVYKGLMDAEGETNRRKLEALKKHIAKRTAYLNEIKNTGNLDRFLKDRERVKTVLDEEAKRMKAAQQKVKNDVDNMLYQREFKNLNALQRGQYWFGRFSKGVLISNPAVLARIAGSVVFRGIYKAPTALSTLIWTKMAPESVTMKSVTESFHSVKDFKSHIGTYYTVLFSRENFKEMVDAFKQHNTNSDLLYDKYHKNIPIPEIKSKNPLLLPQKGFFKVMQLLDKNASLHGAGKSLAALPEQRAYEVTIASNFIRSGITPESVGSPVFKEMVNQLAYLKSRRAKFMQDNYVAGAQRSIEQGLRQKGLHGTAEVVNMIAPITTIASNYISEAMTKIPGFGLLAAHKPIEQITANFLRKVGDITIGEKASEQMFGKKTELTEKDASILMRTLAYQGVGAMSYATGWMLSPYIAPFFKSPVNKYAKKQNGDEEDTWFGRLWETLSHSPDAVVMQAGATHHYFWQKYDEENPDKDISMSEFMDKVMYPILSNEQMVASSSPYLSSGQSVIAPLVTGLNWRKAAANFITSRTPFYTTSKEIAEGKIPFFNKLGVVSKNEEKVKPYEVGIYPETFLDNIGIGVPGWRDKIIQRLYDEKYETRKPKETNEEKHDAKVSAHEKKVKLKEFKEQMDE